MRRSALLAACVLAAAVALPVDAAAPRPQLEDPAGDALNGEAANDVISVGYALVDGDLVVTMRLASAPSPDPLASYGTDADVSGCGWWSYQYSPGSLDDAGELYVGCASETPTQPTGTTSGFLPLKVTVDGSNIVWSLAAKDIPKALKTGTVFSRLTAYAGLAEPVQSNLGSNTVGANLDDATSKGAWRFPARP